MQVSCKLFVNFLLVASFLTISATESGKCLRETSKCSPAAPSPVTCDGTGWLKYGDSKCFKLITKWATRDDAAEMCQKEYLANLDLAPPTLVSIKSAQEQAFLTDFVFNISQVKVNVWLSASRNPEDLSEFLWHDGSVVGEDFANWANLDGPTTDKDRSCVQMQSRLAKKDNSLTSSQIKEGKWQDVTCELGNFVLCQKLPRWTMAKLQQTLIDVRTYVQDSNAELKNELAESRNQFASELAALKSELKAEIDDLRGQIGSSKTEIDNLRGQIGSSKTEINDLRGQIGSSKTEINDLRSQIGSSKTELSNLKANPVPIGFTYVQLGGQPTPQTVWPNVKWTEVTSTYAGLFFRTEGSGSAAFGQVQAENSPRLSEISFIFGQYWKSFKNLPHYDAKTPLRLQTGAWSGGIFGGPNSGDWKDGVNLFVSGGEVRPRNMAMKIWKRTG